MNYLGHAFIASLERPDPAFVLGAMLPDLVAMAGLRLTNVDARLAPGITYHHRTDAAFHEHRLFIDGQQSLQRALFHEGVRKGPARAMSHIGIEFLIDAAFVPSDGYLRALALGANDDEVWLASGHEAGLVLGGLCQHLLARLWTPHQVTEERLSERLRATLDRRPRLAPSAFEVGLASLKLAEQAEPWKELAPDLAHGILRKLRDESTGGELKRPQGEQSER